MKKFLVGFFAVIGFIVVALIALGITGVVLQKDKLPENLPEKMILTLSLDHELRETVPHSSVLDVLAEPEMTLYETIQTLERARQDSRVEGLIARLDSNGMGMATMQELRDALRRFERSGKFAYVYIDDLGGSSAMTEYWLASAFDQIWLHPVGSLALTGFSAELPFARQLLDKIGIEPELLHQGKYKSFPESVMRDHISDDNRKMTLSMIKSIKNSFYQDVDQTRHVKAAQMDGFIKQSLIPAEDALKGGLIDAIGYRDEFDSYLEQKTDGTEAVAVEAYHADGVRSVPGEKMALVNVHGALTTVPADEAFSDDVVSADLIASTIRDAAEADQVKAIIVRIDSPGGTPLAADILRRTIQIATQSKPVIVSMSNTAASGGYWMSTSANAIVAQPTTLTGSIGVFGGKFNAARLLDKLGVNVDTVSTHDNSDLWSVSKPYSAESVRKVEAMMETTYKQFVNRVAEGRKMTPEQVEKIAQGRVWTGAQAKEIGLVDRLGGLDQAVSIAKDMAKIPEQNAVTLELFPKPLNPVQQFLKVAKQGLPLPFMGSWLKDNLNTFIQNTLVQLNTTHIY